MFPAFSPSLPLQPSLIILTSLIYAREPALVEPRAMPGNTTYVAGFVQGAVGDTSPNTCAAFISPTPLPLLTLRGVSQTRRLLRVPGQAVRRSALRSQLIHVRRTCAGVSRARARVHGGRVWVCEQRGDRGAPGQGGGCDFAPRDWGWDDPGGGEREERACVCRYEPVWVCVGEWDEGEDVSGGDG